MKSTRIVFKCVKVIFLVLAVLFGIFNMVFATGQTFDTKFQLSKGHLQKKLIPYSLYEINVNGLHDCVRECFNIGEGCKAFNFNIRQKTCEFKYKDLASADDSDFQQDREYIFSDITEWPKTLARGCSNHDCKADQLCLPRGNRDFLCVNEDCGQLDTISNGYVFALASTYGSVAVYTCIADYEITSSHSTRTCNNGVWTNTKPTCSPILNIGCYCTESSYLYKGTESTTWNGKKCQRWDAQSPHDHSIDFTYDFPDASLTAAENYCRNPDYDGNEPWCYTVDPNERYTTCAVQKCTSCPKPNFGCYYPGSSHLYDGTKSTTWNGKKCQRWDAQSPHDHSFDLTYDFPDASLTAAENYCRNPDYDGDEPWCYTTDPNERYTTCAVPKC
ncbi:plasminogen-like [Ruditapes philippinarum]|uniref:plasminogen-like n=1 Tax=Ruditapes philippinarum TaxID=129788 RepID=UPI00295A82DA|nr:plasminogen-like [Ruditapes philippinarum]